MLKKFSVLMISFATAATFYACGDSSSGPATSGTSEWREYCLDVINKYRATESKAALTLADESKQSCTDKQSANDLKSNKAHGHFGDCGEFAQNSGPNIPLSWIGSDSAVVDYYLEMMWSEKRLIESGERDPDNSADFSYIGHYLNMSRKSAKSVACGLAKSSDGKTGWFNVNFY